MEAVQLTLFPLYSVEIPPDVPPTNKYLVDVSPWLRIPFITTPECIIIDQYYYVAFDDRHRQIWYALCRCPRCARIHIKRRAAITRSHTSYCVFCAYSTALLQPIEQSDECIIVKRSVPGFTDATALVECPICHKAFHKTRGNIRKDGHTVCQLCAVRRANTGPAHYNWRGGESNNYYYGCDWVYLSACIRARDNYRCRYPDCSETRYTQDRALSVHHIMPFNESHDNNPRNLISLCQTHHLWADWDLDESVPMFENLIMMMYGPDY